MNVYEIDALLENGIQNFPAHEYIFERKDNAFVGRSFSCFARDVRKIAALLLKIGLAHRHILLYGANSYAYMAADTAIMGYVGVSCTLSKEWKAADVARAAGFLQAAAILCDEAHMQTAMAVQQRFPEMRLLSLEELVQQTDEPAEALQPMGTEVCCKIIFSSGTTGIPKAVMLSQGQMFTNYESLTLRTPFSTADRDYLFLPLSHTYGGICNLMYSLCSGMQIYLCSDSKKIIEELQMVKPTVFCGVPLIFERLHAACQAHQIPPAELLGGHIRVMFCGGAFFSPALRAYFKNAGLNLLEAYGLTETSSLISTEYSDPDDTESVGVVMESQEVRIDAPDAQGIGEILVRGSNLFSGYYGNAAATAAAFDAQGFFHTGDLGRLEGRKLYLKGRKRRIILLSNGENVFPDEIEAKLTACPQIQSAKVFAQNEEICAVVYTLTDCNIQEILSQVNAELPRYAHIARAEIITDGIDVRLK